MNSIYYVLIAVKNIVGAEYFEVHTVVYVTFFSMSV